MALNPAYEAIGKSFVEQYYLLFDDVATRPNLANMYNADSSFMTFEGIQLRGAKDIMEKFNGLGFQKIVRQLSAVDSQPMFDGGIIINVFGRLKNMRKVFKQAVLEYGRNYSYYTLLRLDFEIIPVTLQTDDDLPHAYNQTFVLKPIGTSFYLQHDIFRLIIHDN